MTLSNDIMKIGYSYDLDLKLVRWNVERPVMADNHFILTEEINPLNPEEVMFFVTHPGVSVQSDLTLLFCKKDSADVIRTSKVCNWVSENCDNHKLMGWYAHVLAEKSVCFMYPAVTTPFDFTRKSVSL